MLIQQFEIEESETFKEECEKRAKYINCKFEYHAWRLPSENTENYAEFNLLEDAIAFIDNYEKGEILACIRNLPLKNSSKEASIKYSNKEKLNLSSQELANEINRRIYSEITKRLELEKSPI